MSSRCWYRSWLICERCQMKLCDQCSSGRSIKDTHSSYSYKLCCCFLVWDFGLFPPSAIHCNIQIILGENSTSANKTWLSAIWLGGMWSSRFPIVCFTLHSTQQLTWARTQLLLVIVCSTYQTVSKTSHRSGGGWLSKTLLAEHNQLHIKQCFWKKKEVCEQIKAFLALFSSIFFFLPINQMRLSW